MCRLSTLDIVNTIASEQPRKVIVFLNPDAKNGKTKYLLEKHVLPLLHLAGIEIHVVRTEHEGQAKEYMGVFDKNIVDAIVVAGGDGTLSQIVTGLLRRGDEIAQRLPIGVLPFGSNNNFATRIFPKRELEVERYCEASMAFIANKYTLADVIEVEQTAPSAQEISSESEEGSKEGNKNVYVLSDLKWGVHSDVDRLKSKYWYFPGPLKEYYCYLKKVLFSDWPIDVQASAELSPPCDGCRNCYTPEETEDKPKPEKSVWLQINNTECGETYKKEISSPQLNIATVPKQDSECQAAALEVTVSPPTSKSQLLTERLSSLHSESLLVSSIHLEPKTENPCYLMDNEKFEVMPAKFTLLKDKIKIFKS
ncbi:hypothetical protein EB796_010835 [Bugula neritina]|uniref:Acylglycerol kinase, mitochondrial n=1 Tax=Bugula neritina TaxID=10212 RepID=A0A7J7JWW5_BUGNE|nr:hypothetical protein EB796_010835 [Bugula neritina]